MGYQPPFLFHLTIQSILGRTIHIKKYYNISAHFSKWPFTNGNEKMGTKKREKRLIEFGHITMNNKGCCFY